MKEGDHVQDSGEASRWWPVWAAGAGIAWLVAPLAPAVSLVTVASLALAAHRRAVAGSRTPWIVAIFLLVAARALLVFLTTGRLLPS